MSAIVPVLFAIIIIFAIAKKVNVYDCFLGGIEEAKNLVLSLLPYLIAVYMACNLFEACGLYTLLENVLAPLTRLVGVPEQLIKLIIIKPFSGSGALAHLTELIKTFGADSYIARCGCVIYGCSETVFYISAVYFAKSKNKKLFFCTACVLFANIVSVICACLICKVV